jgi:iron complex transport system substrate-binding protein
MALNEPRRSPMRSRRGVSAAWFIIGLLVVGGAAIAGTAAYYELRPSPPAGSLIVTDDLGRTVTIPNNPARVAVLSPSVMDTMFRLGLRHHVTAVDCYSAAFGGLSADYSPDQVATWNLSSSMCVQVGPTFNFEQLLNATPDLVLASTIISVSDVEEIQSTYHIPVLLLQPPTLSGVIVDVNLLGRIFNSAVTAEQLGTQLQVMLGAAGSEQQNLTNSGSTFPTVLVTYSTNPAGSPSPGYYTFGPGTFGQSLIELASATSISANATLPYPELSGAQVLASDPTFILYGIGFGLNESTYALGPDWSQFTAVENGHAIGIDSNWLTEPDPTMILSGLPKLLALFHPPGAA